jgi:hypothetical protein
VRRYVWCAAGGRVLHGRTRSGPAPRPGFWRRLFGGSSQGGTIYEFEAIELAAARAALEAHFAAPGAFSVETAEGARLDFLVSRADPAVTIDCWFFEVEEELDVLVLERAAARELLEALFEPHSDQEIARALLALAERRVAA